MVGEQKTKYPKSDRTEDLEGSVVQDLCVHSQYVAEFLQVFQSLLTPALGSQNLTALAKSSLWTIIAPFLLLPLLAHVYRKRPAVKLQHSLLENGIWREEEEGPDDGDGPLLEASGTQTRETASTFFLPDPQLLQPI